MAMTEWFPDLVQLGWAGLEWLLAIGLMLVLAALRLPVRVDSRDSAR